MTQVPEPEVSLYDLFASTPQGRLGLAAAKLAGDAVEMLNNARDKANMSSQELAEAVGVTPSRVSQVMNGDGNIKLSTLARFMDAMGFPVRLECDSLDAPSRQVGRGSKATHQTVEVCYGNTDGVGTRTVKVPNGQDGAPATLLWAAMKVAGRNQSMQTRAKTVQAAAARIDQGGVRLTLRKVKLGEMVLR